MGVQGEIGGGIAALYAHALAIEREAAARYEEFAVRMEYGGNDALARLFGELARFEDEHAHALECLCAGLALPEIVPHLCLNLLFCSSFDLYFKI